MQRKGQEYIEDRLLAESIYAEELKGLASKKTIRELQEKVDDAYVNLLVAQDLGQAYNLKEIDALQQLYDKAMIALESEKKKSFNNKGSSTEKLVHMLGHFSDAKKISIKPIRIFNDHEMILINEHYQKLPEDLRKLMDTTINDERISLELIPNPVFILKEGHIYDNKTINDLLKDKQEAMAPYNQNIKFNKADIIPCNTLIKATERLLDIINEKKLMPEIKDQKLSSINKIYSRKRIPLSLIGLIEYHYCTMEDKHKVLFDAICRDPVTNEIMDDPVLLPDGFVYDRSTALAYLKFKSGMCPLNQEVFFKNDDITTCYFVIDALEQLKQNIFEKIKASSEPTEKPKPNMSGI